MKTLCTLLVLSVLGMTFWACPAEASWVDKHMKRATTIAVESVKAIQSTKARGGCDLEVQAALVDVMVKHSRAFELVRKLR